MDNLSTQGDELRTQQELLDTAVKTWEELLPGCVADPGMSEPALVRNLRIRTLRLIFKHLRKIFNIWRNTRPFFFFNIGAILTTSGQFWQNLTQN